MIGRMKIDAPRWNDVTRRVVEENRSAGQSYAAMQHLGVWSREQDAPLERLCAGYQHVQQYPEDAAQWLLIAHAHVELGETDRALAVIDEMIRVGRWDLFEEVYQEDLRVNRAHILAAAGRTQEALTLLQSLEKQHGGSPIYHYTLGTLQHELQHFEEALTQYRTASRLLEEGRETVEDEIEVDAVLNAILAQRVLAESGESFDGRRPLQLELLAEPTALRIELEDLKEGETWDDATLDQAVQELQKRQQNN